MHYKITEVIVMRKVIANISSDDSIKSTDQYPEVKNARPEFIVFQVNKRRKKR